MNILVVEDDEMQSEHIGTILNGAGYEVRLFDSVESACKTVDFFSFDLLILDLMLKGKSGHHLVKFLRKKAVNIPILVLSSISESDVKVELLNLGVDDFVNKPFNGPELIARINAIARRCVGNASLKKIGNMSINCKENRLIKDGETILLTNIECRLLYFLMTQKGKVVRTDDILNKIWQTKPGYHSNVVQATITRLRKKLYQKDGKEIIRSVHGVGYKLDIG